MNQQAFYARERQLLQMWQSKRLLDARARNQAAAAGLDVEIDGRLSLGLNLLRGAVTGNLAALSDVQLRGALANAFVALLTPHREETLMKDLGPV